MSSTKEANQGLAHPLLRLRRLQELEATTFVLRFSELLLMLPRLIEANAYCRPPLSSLLYSCDDAAAAVLQYRTVS